MFYFRYAEKNNLPILKNVSLPRVGALQVIMENLGHVDNVSDSDESESENQKIKSNSFITKKGTTSKNADMQCSTDEIKVSNSTNNHSITG